MDNKNIAYTWWNFTYHMVFILKYRRKIMYSETNSERKKNVRNLSPNIYSCLTHLLGWYVEYIDNTKL